MRVAIARPCKSASKDHSSPAPRMMLVGLMMDSVHSIPLGSRLPTYGNFQLCCLSAEQIEVADEAV